jgi:hypothetical protein
MAITVENGSGLANAESYITVAEANSYHSLRGNTTWATITTEQAEQSLRRATDYLQQVYGGLWYGYKTTDTQALDWPRENVPKYDTSSGNYYTNNVIPQELKNACAEMAWKAAQGELLADLTQTVKREKIDVLEVEYSEFSPQSKRYLAIDSLLSRFMQQSSNGVFRKLAR